MFMRAILPMLKSAGEKRLPDVYNIFMTRSVSRPGNATLLADAAAVLPMRHAFAACAVKLGAKSLIFRHALSRCAAVH